MSDKTFDDKLASIEKSINKSKQPKKQEKTEMKKLTINPQVKGGIKAITVVLFIIGLIAIGWMLHDQFDAMVMAQAQEFASKISR